MKFDEPDARLDYRHPDVPPPVPRGAKAAGCILLNFLFVASVLGFFSSFEAYPDAGMWRAAYGLFGAAFLIVGWWLILKK
jgi:hypothetical protein